MFDEERAEIACCIGCFESQVHHDVVGIVVRLKHLSLCDTGLFQRRREPLERLEPGRQVADLVRARCVRSAFRQSEPGVRSSA